MPWPKVGPRATRLHPWPRGGCRGVALRVWDLHDAKAGEGFDGAQAGFEGGADEIFCPDFLEGLADGFGFNQPGDDKDAVEVAEDEVTGFDADAGDFDGDAEVDDLAA